jgi:SAM-dependent methyltransferase
MGTGWDGGGAAGELSRFSDDCIPELSLARAGEAQLTLRAMNDHVVPFRPHRFQSAAPYYIAGRQAYPPPLIERVVELCRLDKRQRVLDLGCGPGQLALAFAPFVAAVAGMDPEPAMLALAGQRAAEAGLRLELIEGSSYDLAPSLGRFDLVVIGRAFHWMDRADTLRRLDRLIEAGGAVVLFDDDHPKVADNRWRGDFTALIDEYAASDDDRRKRKAADWPIHESFLLDSPFARLERICVVERQRTPVERLVDRALSMSSTTLDRLGPKATEFAGRIRAAVETHAVEGLITEVVEASALIARRAAS